MAEYSSFFKSIGADRLYTADQFAEYFRSFLTDGVFNGGTALQVSSDEADMTVDVAIGKAWVQGYYYSNTAIMPLTIADADISNDRIDRIVVRLDLNDDIRNVKLAIKEGIPAMNPVAPDLIRNLDLGGVLQYELSLAQIRVNMGEVTIKASQIMDERLNNEFCGLVESLIQADTTNIFNQFQSYLDIKKDDFDNQIDIYNQQIQDYLNQWNNWFELKTNEIDGDFYLEWKEWFDTIQDTTNLVTNIKFVDEVNNLKIQSILGV